MMTIPVIRAYQVTGRGIPTMSDQFCHWCGAGIGKYKREGEGTCPRCEPPKVRDTRPGATFKPQVGIKYRPIVFAWFRHQRYVPIGNGRTILTTVAVPVIAWPGVTRILPGPRGRPDWHKGEDHCQPRCQPKSDQLSTLDPFKVPGLPIVGHRD